MNRRVAVLAVALTASAVGCKTTIDTSLTVPPSAATTTVFAPTGTPAQLLHQLLTESDHLSDLIVDNHGQQDALARIMTLWAAARPDVEARRPQLIPGFQSAIDLLETGVDRRRPADADKATNNLRTLITAYTG